MIKMGRRIGVMLSGCGVKDGTEVHEAVLTLLEIDRQGSESLCIAPQRDQHHVVNHLDGSELKRQKRDVLEESARIARGDITRIENVGANDIDGLIFPGGLGAAKNLSDYALKGREMTVIPEAERLIREMHDSRKPMGFICVAPLLAARVLGEYSPSLTVGNDGKEADVMDSFGARHAVRAVNEIETDVENLLVSTPAYMMETGIAGIAEGIGKLVSKVIELCG